MNKEEQKKDFQARLEEVLSFASGKDILIEAVQKLSNEGYLETIPLYRDLKKYEAIPTPTETTK